MPPSRQLEVVAQGRLLERQMRDLLGGPSKTTKELLQSLLLANAEAAAAADAQVAAEAARKASAAEAEAAVDAKVAAEAALAEARTQVSAAQAAAEAALAEARAQASAAQVVAEAAREASAAEAVAAVDATVAAETALAATTAAVGPAGPDLPGSVGAITRMLQDALQGPGHSDAGLVAGLTAGLPTDQQIQVVLPFLQDPAEGLVPARVATALFQGFGRPAAATVAALFAAPTMAPWDPVAGLSAPGAASGDRDPIAGLSAPGAASGDRLGAGLGASASGDDVSQDDFEDTARLAYQRLHQDLGPPIHTQFLATVLPAESEAALRQLREIGKRQHWDSLQMGDASALGAAILAAWSSGQHGSLSSGDREELTAVKAISEFQGMKGMLPIHTMDHLRDLQSLCELSLQLAGILNFRFHGFHIWK